MITYLLLGLLCALTWWFLMGKKQYKDVMNGRKKKDELVLGFHLLIIIWPIWLFALIAYGFFWFLVHFTELYMKAFNATLGR